MIGVGEATGALDTMLSKIADFYEEEVDTAVAGLLTLLEPIMIAFLGIVVGGIVIAMYLPIFGLISELAGLMTRGTLGAPAAHPHHAAARGRDGAAGRGARRPAARARAVSPINPFFVLIAVVYARQPRVHRLAALRRPLSVAHRRPLRHRRADGVGGGRADRRPHAACSRRSTCCRSSPRARCSSAAARCRWRRWASLLYAGIVLAQYAAGEPATSIRSSASRIDAELPDDERGAVHGRPQRLRPLRGGVSLGLAGRAGAPRRRPARAGVRGDRRSAVLQPVRHRQPGQRSGDGGRAEPPADLQPIGGADHRPRARRRSSGKPAAEVLQLPAELRDDARRGAARARAASAPTSSTSGRTIASSISA